ncbi:MAG: 16S rRNA (guanine(527)-N(7))-methyltransferase RsmG [Halioglobus sp.]
MPDTGAAQGLELQAGCRALGLVLSQPQAAQLADYLALLARWNKSYNLTAVRDPREMVTRHIFDSLSVASRIEGGRVLDVGTGAGLPGVPLSIVFPERTFHLLDSNGKKTRFLFQVKTALGLDNIVIHHTRVESFAVTDGFDTVVSRAFASVADMLERCRHLLAPGGVLLAMKGVYPAQELNAVSLPGAGITVHPLAVPGLNEQRHLVEMRLQSAVAPRQA